MISICDGVRLSTQSLSCVPLDIEGTVDDSVVEVLEELEVRRWRYDGWRVVPDCVRDVVGWLVLWGGCGVAQFIIFTIADDVSKVVPCGGCENVNVS